MKSSSENPFISLIANLFLPIFILNKLSSKIGPTQALGLALMGPLLYGAWSLWKKREISPITVLGLLNILVTGGFAISGLSGIWFAVKEAAFPTLIGIFVLFSSRTKSPFIETLFLNPQVMHIEKLKEDLALKSAETQFHELLKRGTIYLSFSFFVSGTLNFFLASRVFMPIDPNLAELERAHILNQQIAEMTGWTMPVIVVPSMIIMGLLMFYILKSLEKMTEKSWQDYMKS